MRFGKVDNYGTLYDEIVVRDTYKVTSLMFAPDVVFDIGANIGMFTHHARKLFPGALIVAVEPHPPNVTVLKAYIPDDRVIVLDKSIGSGQTRQYLGDGGGDETGTDISYYSQAFGYKPGDLNSGSVIATDIQSVLLDELCEKYVSPGQRFTIKLDCEGAENLLFEHPPSVEVLQRADFVAAELHPFWMMGHERDHGDYEKTVKADKVIAARMDAILGDSHRCDSEVPMYYAWRKPEDEPIAGREEFGRLLAERGLLGNAAEIGVASGEYSRDILNWGVKHLLLVDPWNEAVAPWGISDEQQDAYYQECLDHIRGCEDRTTILRVLSLEAAGRTPDNSLDFCYIDANHAYEGISADLLAWWPKLRSGGILAGHDYLPPEYGVNRAVTEFAAERGLHVHLVIEHQRDASFWIEKP